MVDPQVWMPCAVAGTTRARASGEYFSSQSAVARQYLGISWNEPGARIEPLRYGHSSPGSTRTAATSGANRRPRTRWVPRDSAAVPTRCARPSTSASASPVWNL